MKQLPRGYTLNGVIGAILDAAQLLLDVAGLIQARRSGVESDGSSGLVLLNIYGDQQASQQRQRAARNAEQARESAAKTGPTQD